MVAATLLLLWFVWKLRQAREALARSQERLALTLHSSGIAIWSWEIATNTITADENCSILAGLPLGRFPKAVEGFFELVHPDDRSRVQQEIAAVVERNADFNSEFRVVWPEGTIRYVAVRGKVHIFEKLPQRLTGVSWDVTERRKAEEDLRASHATLAQSLRDLLRRRRENETLGQMIALLQACPDSREGFRIIAEFCGHLFPTCAGALYTLNPSENVVSSVATWGDPLLVAGAFDPADCWALRSGHPHIVSSGLSATPCPHVKGIPRDAHACFPLMARGSGLGILYLQARQPSPSEKFLTAPLQQLAVIVANIICLALANLNLQEALKQQSIRDSLTSLLGRH